MPVFSPKGPLVPDALVQAIEDDRAVIFCGAGISVGAGLPTYGGLVQHCYDELAIEAPKSKVEWLWPDRLLGTLEDSCTPGEVRRVVAERLHQAPATLEIHKAVLALAKLNRAKGLRLVTTNFDTFFEQAQDQGSARIDTYSAPALPIPRNDRITSWRSVVYLHGRLANDASLPHDHLVLTSADFGRAYLTEAWAARFVTRLFADFTVLFIGYSLNDPVLRYMTDAFAAEAAVSRNRSQRGPAYIFVGYKGRSAPDPTPWKNRLIEPIFYHQDRNHLRLKQTLIAWAAAREDFLSSTQAIVARFSPRLPQSLNPSDTENLMWALFSRPSDQGQGARVFSALNPAPPLEWLFEFERREAEAERAWADERDRAEQTGEDIPARPESHVSRLTPRDAESAAPLTPVAGALISWFIKQLPKAELVEWVIRKLENGRRLHPWLRDEIRRRLPDLSLPSGYTLFWRIAASEANWVHSEGAGFAWLTFTQELRRDPTQPWIHQELLSLLRPYLHFTKSFSRLWQESGDDSDTLSIGETLDSIASVEVRLAAHQSLTSIVGAINELDDPDGLLAQIWFGLTRLIVESLDIFSVAGRANFDIDPSAFERPSIKPHGQNHDFREWTVLFDLLWRAWVRIDATSAEESRAIVSVWRTIPYFAFRRLVLAALGHSIHFTDEEKLEALLDA